MNEANALLEPGSGCRCLSPADRVEMIIQEHGGDIVSSRMMLDRSNDVPAIARANAYQAYRSRRERIKRCDNFGADNPQPLLKIGNKLILPVPFVPISQSFEAVG
jgi:hypothetical protein